jgi:5-methylcytosine-specific restriction endonuclease McrA
MLHIVGYTEAKKLGLKRYFTGKPCKHGHVAERNTVNGCCLECARIKQAARRVSNPDKVRAVYRAWKQRNPEVAKAATERWRANNPEKLRQQARRKYRKHRERILAVQRDYNTRNSKRIVARVLAWAKENPDRVRRNSRNWNARNPDKVRLNGARQAARRRNAPGTFSDADICRLFVFQEGECVYCRRWLDKYHIDHVVPLARGGSNDPSNLQLLCRSCNSHKAARDPVEFARSIGMHHA